MSALATPAPGALQILDARPTRVGGLGATRYRLYRPHVLTGDDDLDRALSTFEAMVVPPARPRADAPVVTLLNGITKGMDRSVPAARALADAGIGVVLFDTPLGGVRRPGPGGNPGMAVAEITRRGHALDVPFARRLFDGVAADFPAVLALADREHGLGRDGRVALFGVSFGALLSSYAFGRDGVGQRLLGAIGHPGLPAMARGLADTFVQFSGLPQAVVASGLRMGPLAEAAARQMGGEAAVGVLRFGRLLLALGRGGRSVEGLDPLGYAGRVGADRPAAFLAGERDPVAPPADVRAAAEAYPSHAVDVLPGLGHGWYPSGPPRGALSFEAASGAFALRHLADWRTD